MASQASDVSVNVNNTTSVTSISVNEDSMMTDISTATAKTVTNGTNGTHANGTHSNGIHSNEAIGIERIVRPGYALAVGENLSNQLGLGSDIDNRKKPQIVKELPTNVVQVASGGMHSACLTEDGLVRFFSHFHFKNKHFY